MILRIFYVVVPLLLFCTVSSEIVKIGDDVFDLSQFDGDSINITLSHLSIHNVHHHSSTQGYNLTNHALQIFNDPLFRHHMKKYGVVHIPGAIHQDLIHKALYHINYDIGQFHPDIQMDSAARARYHSNHSNIMNLYHKSFLPRLFENVLGKRQGDHEYKPMYQAAQLPVRFPDDQCVYKYDHGKMTNEYDWEQQRKGWHIDSIANLGDSGHHQNIHNFDATIAVLLSDTHGKYSGELVTYPGSHLILASHFKNTKNLFEDLHIKGLDALPRYDKSDALLGKKPYHCLGKAGDVFILNYMNAHLPNCNLSPFIRYAAFFRLMGGTFPADLMIHFTEKPESMFDPLLHWHI